MVSALGDKDETFDGVELELDDVDSLNSDDETVDGNGIDSVGSPTGGDETDGDDGVKSPTGGDRTMGGNETGGVDPPTGGDRTIDGHRTDGADEIETTDACSIFGVMLSGVELGSWTMVVPFKAPELLNGTRRFPSWGSWDSYGIDDLERGT